MYAYIHEIVGCKKEKKKGCQNDVAAI